MSENWKIQVSPKLPDGTLINLRAEDSTEANKLFAWAQENAGMIVSTSEALIAAARFAPAPGTSVATTQAPPQQGGWNEAQDAPNWAYQNAQQAVQQQPPPQAQPQSYGPPAATCRHGQRVARSGVSAKGPWSAQFCPQPKGSPDACEAIWSK